MNDERRAGGRGAVAIVCAEGRMPYQRPPLTKELLRGEVHESALALESFWSTIGTRTLKYAAWGDGYDEVVFERRADGAFTAHYLHEDRFVGVLAHQADDAYESGQQLIAQGASWR